MSANACITQSEAARRAAKRFLRAEGSIRVAFEGLGLGWTLEDVQAWTEDTPLWREMPEELHAQLVGAMMASGLVVVEKDREPW